MKECSFEIKENRPIAANTCRMVLAGDVSAITRPGQFVNIRLDGFFLRRPLSVADATDGRLTLIYKTVGRGTEAMSRLAPGGRLSVLTGLGNGFNLEKSGARPLLVGGGAGVAPLYMLAAKLKEQGKAVRAALGFNTAAEIFLADELKALGAEVTVTTADGTAGVKGFVTDAIDEAEYTYFYACGPENMFKALEKEVKTSGQYSFEERMGCGFGACMGCSCRTKYGDKRICRDGPVLEREEIIW